jgi:hypothetical protein
MKNKETLEEVFDEIDDKLCRYSTEESEYWNHYKIGVLDGLKWQQQRSYSEEEVAIAFNEGQAYSVTGKLVDGKEWVKTHKKEWFNEFKNK